MIDVVVGAGSGMGAAVAALLGRDRPLLLVDRNADAVAGVAAKLVRGTRVDMLECDITDDAACERLAERVPQLGALVVTAGLSPTMASGDRIVDVNLAGVARVLVALDGAVSAGSAAVLFASISGHGPVSQELLPILDDPLAPNLAGRLRAAGAALDEPVIAYGVSKHGVIRLARRTAKAWLPRKARIVSLSPGIIETPMGDQELAQQPVMKPMIDLVGRMGSADEVAAVAAFLVSDQASFMTGSDVLVDGGITAFMS